MPGMTRHATAVAVGGRGVLILGRPGAGKSSLAIAMLALGAQLVADDQVALAAEGGRLIAAAPARIAGLIEARGFGLLRAEPSGPVPVTLAVDLDASPAARLPQRQAITICGVEIDLLSARNVPHLDAVLMLLLQNGRGPE